MEEIERPINFIMYNYIYRFGQNLISKLLYTKENFKIDIAKLNKSIKEDLSKKLFNNLV